MISFPSPPYIDTLTVPPSILSIPSVPLITLSRKSLVIVNSPLALIRSQSTSIPNTDSVAIKGKGEPGGIGAWGSGVGVGVGSAVGVGVGSAAGVAVMGILKVDFIWYVKKISFIAVLGYFAGAMTYYIQEEFFGNDLEQKETYHQELPINHKNTITYK